MVNSDFYSKQYSAMMFTLDKAITFLEEGRAKEAKTLLEASLLAAEEAYIQASEETSEDANA